MDWSGLDWTNVIIGMTIIITVSIISIIFWYKKIDTSTTWLYGIYVIVWIIVSLFVLTYLALFWSTQ